ncbi:hypothetical protein NGRA_2579 [Nosema granulosis]|uniref:Serpin domain-containing protein n=1 Tax=Nosema granulosis TaxID=83296 RepID=A0A9P6GZ38_9MICR|nr:hypothetical protein NGRA_2579 [Nosema granulosis]
MYDIAVISHYLRESKDCVSAFSPIASEESLMIMASQGLLEDFPYVKSTKSYLDELRKNITLLDANTFSVSHGNMETGSILIPKKQVGFFQKIKNLKDEKDVFEKYPEWLKEYAEVDLESKEIPTSKPIEEKTLEGLKNGSALGEVKLKSFSYFKDEWQFAFNKKNSFCGNFELKDGSIDKDHVFMKKTAFIKFKRFSLENVHFDMVVLPFDKRPDSENITRFMIYLIPKENNCDLESLWITFSSYKEGKIDLIINEDCKDYYISLCVPKISNLISKTNIVELYDGRINKKLLNFDMTTFIDIDEGAKKSKKSIIDIFTWMVVPVGFIKADRSHISFVYDFRTKRIPIFIKYTGEYRN